MKLILFTNLSIMPFLKGKLTSFGTNGQNIAIIQSENIKLWENDREVPKNLQVIIVNDWEKITGDDETTIRQLIYGDEEICVVYHNNTKFRQSQEKIFIEIPYQHISRSQIEGSIYQEIDKWAEQGCESSNLSEIIKKNCPNKKLEAALEFLHQCLEKKPNDLSIFNDLDIETPKYYVEEKDSKVKKNIKELIDRLADPPLTDIKTFEDLRDGLLDWAIYK